MGEILWLHFPPLQEFCYFSVSRFPISLKCVSWHTKDIICNMENCEIYKNVNHATLFLLQLFSNGQNWCVLYISRECHSRITHKNWSKNEQVTQKCLKSNFGERNPLIQKRKQTSYEFFPISFRQKINDSNRATKSMGLKGGSSS